MPKVHVKSIDSIFRFLHNFTNFHSFWSIFRHTKELAEHFILSGNLFSENEEEKEEKEDENFQLLYFLRYIVNCDIDGFLNHRKSQICQRLPTKIFSFQEPTSFVDLIDLQNRLKTRFFHVNQVQKSCYFFKTNYHGGESFAYL